MLALENAAFPPRSLQEAERDTQAEASLAKESQESVAALRKRFQGWYQRHGWVALCAHGKRGIPVLVYNVPHNAALVCLQQVLCDT